LEQDWNVEEYENGEDSHRPARPSRIPEITEILTLVEGISRMIARAEKVQSGQQSRSGLPPSGRYDTIRLRVRLTPRAHRLHDRSQRAAFLGEQVFSTWGMLAVEPTRDDVLIL